MVDEAPTEADTAEALRQLAQARGNLAATRSHLEDAGILATGGGEMAAE